MKTKNSLSDLIRNASVAKCDASLNLRQNADKKAAFLRHRDICKKLVELSDEFNAPCSFIVYFSVGTDAHKPSVFEKGYKKFDEEKARAILTMAKTFALHNGMKTPTDRVYHALTKFYTKISTDLEYYNKRVAAMTPNKNWENVNAIVNAIVGNTVFA